MLVLIVMRMYLKQQLSYELEKFLLKGEWGEIERVLLGYVVFGWLGDKVSDCNVGFFVCYDDEWEWFCSFFIIFKI